LSSVKPVSAAGQAHVISQLSPTCTIRLLSTTARSALPVDPWNRYPLVGQFR
jgi:hypothetical protein